MAKRQTIWHRLEASADDLRHELKRETLPDTAVVLGSGFRGFEAMLEDRSQVDFADIEHLPTPTVKGHGAQIVVGRLDKREVCVLTGRVHLYERYTAQEVVYPLRLLASLGVQRVVLTNASGSVDPAIMPGTVVLLSDHINLTGRNCLAGMGDDFGDLFVDMQEAYDAPWRAYLQTKCKATEGVYAGVLGPNYETAAETQMLGRMGAHIVGMSTVQETIAARQIGLRVLGISFVTNMAGGLGGALSHDDVLALSAKHRNTLHQIVADAVSFD